MTTKPPPSQLFFRLLWGLRGRWSPTALLWRLVLSTVVLAACTAAGAPVPDVTATPTDEPPPSIGALRTVVKDWYLFPLDTTLGEEGLPLDHVAGPLRQHHLWTLEATRRLGLAERATGRERITIIDIQTTNTNPSDPTGHHKVVMVLVCTLDGHELFDPDVCLT